MAGGYTKEKIVDTAVLVEIEKLRRASLATLREKHREVIERWVILTRDKLYLPKGSPTCVYER